VYIRILFFYIAGIWIISLLVPSNDPGLALGGGTAAASPFVIAIKRSGIKFLPGVRFCPCGPRFSESRLKTADLYSS